MAWIIPYLEIWIVTNDWKQHIHLLFMTWFKEQFAPVPVSAGVLFLGPTGPEACNPLLAVDTFGGIVHEAVITDTWLWLIAGLHNRTHETAEKEKELRKILVWVQITRHFASWIKANALKLTLFTMLRVFKHPPKAEDHHATGNSSMNYVQNLQRSLHNSLHCLNTFTFVFSACFQDTDIFVWFSVLFLQ